MAAGKMLIQPYTWGPGYNALDTADFCFTQPVDLGIGRRGKLNRGKNKDLINTYKNSFDAIELGSLQFIDFMLDSDRLHNKWEFKESHQLLRAIEWHIENPFRPTLAFVKANMIEKSTMTNGLRTFREIDISELQLSYQKAKEAVDVLIKNLAVFKRRAGESLRHLDQGGIPAASPFELYLEVLRRVSAERLGSERRVTELIGTSSQL